MLAKACQIETCPDSTQILLIWEGFSLDFSDYYGGSGYVNLVKVCS